MILIWDDKLLKFALMLLTIEVVVCEKKILTFTAHERGNVQLRCPYEPGYEEKKKYLCRGECPVLNKDILVESGSPAKDGRFSLTDDTTARVFTITITDLRTKDEGRYWCGTDRRGYDVYNKIDLRIKHVSRVSAVSGQNLSITCPYNRNMKYDVKFVCKGSEASLCVKSATKVSSDTRNNGRFFLKDDQSEGVFNVSIRDLREEDSGIYWCGAVEGKTHKWISVKELNISNVSPERPSHRETTTASFHSSKPTETASDRAVTSPSSSASTSSSSTSSQTTSPPLFLLLPSSANEVLTETESGFTTVIMLIVIGILTGFGFGLFLYFRRRKKKEGTQSENVDHLQTNHRPNGDLQTTIEDNHVEYEEISNALDHPDYTMVLPEFGDPDISVYALAQLPSSPSDSLHYSSVRFSALLHSDRIDTQGTSDYATVIL